MAHPGEFVGLHVLGQVAAGCKLHGDCQVVRCQEHLLWNKMQNGNDAWLGQLDEFCNAVHRMPEQQGVHKIAVHDYRRLP